MSQHISGTSPNKQEQSSSSFRIPEPTTTSSRVNTTTHAGFTPISNSVPPIFNILNNRGTFAFVNDTNNCASNSNNSDSRSFLFSTDRFNSPLLQPNISPYVSIINNDPRLHPTSAILPTSLRQHNSSVGINANETTFDRFLQPFPTQQGTTAINPMISVASVTPTIPAVGHTSLLPVATANNNSGPSASSFIPPPPLMNDQPYKYLLSFEQQAKIAHEAAMHYANLTEHLMEHARNAAAAENMPLPPLPQAVFSMVQKYDQQKESLQNFQQQQKREEEKKDPKYPTHRNIVSFSHSDTITYRNISNQQQTVSESFMQKRSFTASPSSSAFSEPVMKVRYADNVSNTDTTPSRSESDSSNKTTTEILPILSPHPYCTTSTENNFEQQQQNEVELDESGRKHIAETVAIRSFIISSISLIHTD